MGHKSDSSTASGHHHHHQHRRVRTHREPSVHSLSSSDISSEASSIHRRSTPKIAAVIITAIIVIAGLVGITVYLIDSDRFEKKAAAASEEIKISEVERVNVFDRRRNDAALDYQTYHDDSASVMQKHQLNNHQMNHHYRKKNLGYRDGKDPEGPERLYEDYSYDEDEDTEPESPHHQEDINHGSHNNKKMELVVDGTGDRLDFFGREALGSGMFGEQQFVEEIPKSLVTETELLKTSASHEDEVANHRALHHDVHHHNNQAVQQQSTQQQSRPPPFGFKRQYEEQTEPTQEGGEESQWPEEVSERRTDFYDMSQFQDRPFPFAPHHNHRRLPLRPRQKFFRPGTLMQNPHASNRQVAAAEVQDLQVSEEETMAEGSDANHSLPPNGSRGGIHVPVSSSEPVKKQLLPQQIRKQPMGYGGALTNLDRRPGRPAFHHMGPPRFGPAMRRRFQQQMINRRLGLAAAAASNQKPSVVLPPNAAQFPANPVLLAKKLLSQYDSFIAIAESEAQVLKNIAVNITAQGKEINLWEMLNAVNATMKDNPDSAIGKLMNRFYNNYLMSEDTMGESNNVVPVSGVYEKSLSSLLFLAFGIFLLNSVNEIINQRGLSEARTFSSSPENDILKTLLTDHSELLELFPSRTDDDKEEEDTNQDMGKKLVPAGQSPTINNFMKLVMNLMNAYNSGNDNEVECIWSLYCHQLNRQAAYGGMVSSVARINSVGMRVVLKDIPAYKAVPSIFRNLFKWKEMKCDRMFPKCGKKFEEKIEEMEKEMREDAEATEPTEPVTEAFSAE